MNHSPHLEMAENPTSDSIRKGIEIGCNLVLLLAMGCAIDFVYLGSLAITGYSRLFIVVLVLLCAIRSRVVLLLVAMLVSLILRTPARTEDFDLPSIFILTFVSLGLLYWIFCYQSIRRSVCDFVFDLCLDQPNQRTTLETRDQLMYFVRSGIGLGLKLSVAILVSLLLLQNHPWGMYSEGWFQWSLTNQQILWPGPLLIVILIGAMIVVNELGWRQKTAAQMKLYLRSISAQILYPDIQRIIRIRFKIGANKGNRSDKTDQSE